MPGHLRNPLVPGLSGEAVVEGAACSYRNADGGVGATEVRSVAIAVIGGSSLDDRSRIEFRHSHASTYSAGRSLSAAQLPKSHRTPDN
jgi:hypothetical protein